LPHLPLEANRSSEAATAIVEEQHGIHRILLADAEANAAGVMPGQAANAALALLPTLLLEERSLPGEQQALERLATWLERFSSFVCIADRDVLLLEIAGSLRLFGGLRELRQKISREIRELGFTGLFSIAPTPLAATWLARSGRRVCIRDETNLAPALRRLPLARLNWPAGLCEALTGIGVTTVGDCLRLPREGFTRRFGAEYLLELDRALGHLPDPRDSWRAPERFCADFEISVVNYCCRMSSFCLHGSLVRNACVSVFFISKHPRLNCAWVVQGQNAQLNAGSTYWVFVLSN
jgi:protein ImuB